MWLSGRKHMDVMEVIMTYFAAFRLRAVPVSIYSTSSTEQVRFITADAKISRAASKLACVSMAPFGSPVVPEV